MICGNGTASLATVSLNHRQRTCFLLAETAPLTVLLNAIHLSSYVLQFAFHVAAHLMGWEMINARCTFFSGSKCSCSSKPCAPAPCFIKITYGFHLPLIGLTSALLYSRSGKLRPVAPSNSSKELWETRALSVSAWLPLVLCVLSLEVFDLGVRTELNLPAQILCRPKENGKRVLSWALPDQLWVICLLFLSTVVSWLWKCFCVLVLTTILPTLLTLAESSSLFGSCQWHKMRQNALCWKHPLERGARCLSTALCSWGTPFPSLRLHHFSFLYSGTCLLPFASRLNSNKNI